MTPPEPSAKAERDTAAAAEAGAPEAPTVEPAVEQVTPEDVTTTRRRAAPAPAWAWVAITFMGLLLAIGLTTFAVVRNVNPSTPEAVEDAQTLVVELEALNGYLATTNELMSDAIASAQQVSASAQAKLAGLSPQLAATGAGVGQARALLGGQLSDATRSELGAGQEQLQSLQRTLAERSGLLAEQELSAVSVDVATFGKDVGAATSRGSSHASRIEALESSQADTDVLAGQTAELQAEAEQLRATIQSQRERAQTLAAQLLELRRALALLRQRVDTLGPRP